MNIFFVTTFTFQNPENLISIMPYMESEVIVTFVIFGGLLF